MRREVLGRGEGLHHPCHRQQRGFGPVFDPQLREGLAFYKANYR